MRCRYAETDTETPRPILPPLITGPHAGPPPLITSPNAGPPPLIASPNANPPPLIRALPCTPLGLWRHTVPSLATQQRHHWSTQFLSAPRIANTLAPPPPPHPTGRARENVPSLASLEACLGIHYIDDDAQPKKKQKPCNDKPVSKAKGTPLGGKRGDDEPDDTPDADDGECAGEQAWRLRGLTQCR
jgi:hypothetical protein